MSFQKSSLLSLFFIVPIILNSAAQEVIVYSSYQDFAEKGGTRYENYNGYTSKKRNFFLKAKNGKEKFKISAKDMWGFQYKDALFRVYKGDNHPARVLVVGKIAYYENGVAHLGMMKFGGSSASFTFGHYCYLSKDLESELIPMPKFLHSKGKVKQFKADNPQYAELFECIENNYNYKNVRPCVVAFEEI